MWKELSEKAGLIIWDDVSKMTSATLDRMGKYFLTVWTDSETFLKSDRRSFHQ